MTVLLALLLLLLSSGGTDAGGQGGKDHAQSEPLIKTQGGGLKIIDDYFPRDIKVANRLNHPLKAFSLPTERTDVFELNGSPLPKSIDRRKGEENSATRFAQAQNVIPKEVHSDNSSPVIADIPNNPLHAFSHVVDIDNDFPSKCLLSTTNDHDLPLAIEKVLLNILPIDLAKSNDDWNEQDFMDQRIVEHPFSDIQIDSGLPRSWQIDNIEKVLLDLLPFDLANNLDDWNPQDFMDERAAHHRSDISKLWQLGDEVHVPVRKIIEIYNEKHRPSASEFETVPAVAQATTQSTTFTDDAITLASRQNAEDDSLVAEDGDSRPSKSSDAVPAIDQTTIHHSTFPDDATALTSAECAVDDLLKAEDGDSRPLKSSEVVEPVSPEHVPEKAVNFPPINTSSPVKIAKKVSSSKTPVQASRSTSMPCERLCRSPSGLSKTLSQTPIRGGVGATPRSSSTGAMRPITARVPVKKHLMKTTATPIIPPSKPGTTTRIKPDSSIVARDAKRIMAHGNLGRDRSKPQHVKAVVKSDGALTGPDSTPTNIENESVSGRSSPTSVLESPKFAHAEGKERDWFPLKVRGFSGSAIVADGFLIGVPQTWEGAVPEAVQELIGYLTTSKN